MKTPLLGRRSLPLFSLLALAGCGGAGFPDVEEPRWIGISVGAPRVKRVRDIGTRVPGKPGTPLVGESDGVASPGEQLVIEGSAFGKSPTVTIGGVAAEVVARTVGQGIVVRVPPAVPTGEQPVEVSVGEARSSLPFQIRRLAVLLQKGVVNIMEVGEAPKRAGVAIPLRGAVAMTVSSDGACAYVLAGRKVVVIDLGAAGGPKAITTRDLTIDAKLLVASLHAQMLFAIGDTAIQPLETTDPRAPARYPEAALPEEARGVIRADVDPEAKRAALLVDADNRVVVIDVSKRDKARLVANVSLLPDARVPLARDLRFAADGETVWVVAGDNPASMVSGTQPSRVAAVRLEAPEEGAGDPVVSLWRVAMVPAAMAPQRIQVARGRAVSSGATIRLPPEKTTVRFSGVSRELLAKSPPAGGNTGAVEQADATGEGMRVSEGPILVGPIDVTPDNKRVVMGALRSGAAGREYGVATVRVDLPPSATPPLSFTPIGAAVEADFAPPFVIGELRLQP